MRSGLIVHYAPSFQSALLSLFLSRTNSSFLVLTQSEAVANLCRKYNVDVSLISLTKPSVKRPMSFFRLRSEIRRLVANFPKNTRLLLSHNSYDIGGFCLGVRWVERGVGTVGYIGMDPLLVRYRIFRHGMLLRGILTYVILAQYSMFLRLRGLQVFFSTYPFLGITSKFLRQIDADKFDPQLPITVREFALNELAIDEGRDILFLDTVYDFSALEVEKCKKLNAVLSSWIDRVIVKPHPSQTKNSSIAFRCAESFVPAEFYMRGSKVVIGFCSEAMRLAQREGKCVISVNYLVFSEGDSYIDFSNKFFAGVVGDNLHFPRTFAALRDLISSEVGHRN